MKKATGGKNLFGFSIGILMLESKFPRIPGDMGNATTWDFPVLYKVVKNASPDAVVRKGDRNLLDSFITASKELEKDILHQVFGVISGAGKTVCQLIKLLKMRLNQLLEQLLLRQLLFRAPWRRP